MKCPLIIDLLHPVKLKPEPKPKSNIIIGNCPDLYALTYTCGVVYSDKKAVEFAKTIWPTRTRFFVNWKPDNTILIKQVEVNILKGGILLTPRIIKNSWCSIQVDNTILWGFPLEKRTTVSHTIFEVCRERHIQIDIITTKALKGKATIEVILSGKVRR